eukprot:5628709-Alexandrium_andersonii.AAC.1
MLLDGWGAPCRRSLSGTAQAIRRSTMPSARNSSDRMPRATNAHNAFRQLKDAARCFHQAE